VSFFLKYPAPAVSGVSASLIVHRFDRDVPLYGSIPMFEEAKVRDIERVITYLLWVLPMLFLQALSLLFGLPAGIIVCHDYS
jgi:hypothetical protein